MGTPHKFDAQFLDEIRNRLLVSEVVGRHVKLKKAGAEWEGLSPFNAENTPSFKVNDQKRLWHCFSSGKTGDIFGIETELTGCSFPAAVERMADLAHVPLPTDGSAGPSVRRNGANGSSSPHHLNGKAKGAPTEAAYGDREAPRPQPPRKTIKAVYDYTDADGGLIYQVVRYEPKTFAQRRPDPNEPNVWIWGLDAGTYVRRGKGKDWYKMTVDREDWPERVEVPEGVSHGLYRFADLREEMIQSADERRIVFSPEGERDCETLHDWGLVATCNSGGAAHWLPHHAEELRGADVVLLLDNDKPGRERADKIGASLRGIASRCRVLDWRSYWPEVLEKGDVTDWRDRAGGTAEKLLEIVDRLPVWLPASFVSKMGAVWFSDVGFRKPVRNWAVKNLILMGQFGLIYGAPGSGKSFLTTDMCLSMASAFAFGQDMPVWFGYRGKPFGVIYVIREDRSDFEIRLQAWRVERKVPDDAVIPFVYLPTALDLRTNDVDMLRLAEEINGLSAEMEARCGIRAGMIVIDTVNHVLGGGNENGSDVMGSFVINCAKLQELVEVSLLGVHHGGKEGGRGPRGHEALHGAAGFEIEVIAKSDAGPAKWTLKKQRAASAGQSHHFALRRVVLGKDEDGDDITSCTVDMLTSISSPLTKTDDEPRHVAKDGRVILRPKGEMAFRALETALTRIGRKAPSHIRAAPDDICVSLTDWRDELAKLIAGEDEDPEKLKERAKKAREAATEYFLSWGLIHKEGDWVWRTGRRVMNIDRPPKRDEGASAIIRTVLQDALDEF